MKRFLILTALTSFVAACSPERGSAPEAAADPGVCWRVRAGAREVLDRVPNLPTCAQRLEAVRMMEGGSVVGAFEGQTIRVTETEITQEPPSGGRYPVFTDGQRREMQAAIRQLLERRAAEPQS